MATTVELTPDIVNQLTKILVNTFGDVSENLAKEISQKAILIANKKSELVINENVKKGTFFEPIKKKLEEIKKEKYDPKQRFKESGLFGLGKDIISFLKPKQETKESSNNLLQPKESKQDSKETKIDPPKLIKEEETPKKVLIEGLTDNGYRDLVTKMPDILKGVFDLSKLKDKTSPNKIESSGGGLLGLLPPGIVKLLGSALMGGGGIALLLGGLAALITGLQTEGPWKGTLKILSRVGLEGGLVLLKKGATKFIDNFKILSEKVADVLTKVKNFFKPLTDKITDFFKPFKDKILGAFSLVKDKVGTIFTSVSDNLLKFVSGIGESITSFFKGSAVGKGLGAIGKLASGAKGVFVDMFAKVIKVIKPIAKRIPVLGTVIGLGFAYTRFKSGDTVGGIIDILSAIATLVPFAGTAISIGLDVLNAFLDAKAGGSGPEAGKKKTGMIGDFFGKIYDYIGEKLSAAFTWIADLGKKVISGNWGEAFVEVAKFVSGLSWVVDLMGGEEAVTQAGNVMGGQTVNFLKGVKDYIFEKINFALGWIGKIGGLVVDGKWGDVIKELANVSPGIKWVVDLMGGEEKVTEAGNAVGGKAINIFQSIKDAIFEKLGPVFEVWGAIGKKFDEGDKLGAIALLCKSTPGLGWLGNILDNDTTKMKFNEGMESGNMLDSIAGVFEDVSKSIYQMFMDNALLLIPDAPLGFPLRAMVAQKLGMKIPPGTTIKADGWIAEKAADIAGYDQKALEDLNALASKTETNQTPKTEINVSQSPQDKNNKEATVTETKMPAHAEGGIVTKPEVALIGEAGPEAVIPLDKYMSPEGFKISNDLLGTIASNTASTNDTIKNLSQAILKLALTFDKKQNTSNVIVNNESQQQQYPSASQVAATNVDPIRQIRMQFAV